MSMKIDARIPVRFLEDEAALHVALAAKPGAAVLMEGPPIVKPESAATLFSFQPFLAQHAAACFCCNGRSSAATTLDGLFQARVRSQVPWFDEVLALLPGPEAREAVDLALFLDPVVSSRFRPA